MKNLNMNDRWAIHDKLDEVNALITDKLYALDSEEDKKELLMYQIEIDKIMYKLVY